jgi:hypothetical protein
VITVGFVIWVSMLRYLIRGVMAANRGQRYEVPGWICARFVNPGLGVGLAPGMAGAGASARLRWLRARSACASRRRPAGGRGG